MMPEGWIAIALLLGLGAGGIFKLIHDLNEKVEEEKQIREEYRRLWRHNINQLIIEIAYQEWYGPRTNKMLTDALTVSIAEYRAF